MEFDFIECGDCAKLLKTLPENSIDLTVIESVKNDRHYIGFEVAEEYFNIACKRLDKVEGVAI